MSQPQATTVVRRAEPCEAATIKPLLNSSLRELDPFTHPTSDDPSTPDYPYFDSYWSEAGRTPYLIQSGDQTAGFDLIRTPASTHTAFHQSRSSIASSDQPGKYLTSAWICGNEGSTANAGRLRGEWRLFLRRQQTALSGSER